MRVAVWSMHQTRILERRSILRSLRNTNVCTQPCPNSCFRISRKPLVVDGAFRPLTWWIPRTAYIGQTLWKPMIVFEGVPLNGRGFLGICSTVGFCEMSPVLANSQSNVEIMGPWYGPLILGSLHTYYTLQISFRVP